jgi:hypothetical protein
LVRVVHELESDLRSEVERVRIESVVEAIKGSYLKDPYLRRSTAALSCGD